jgi:hypothetical protein
MDVFIPLTTDAEDASSAVDLPASIRAQASGALVLCM